jgi:hypothetical protein
MLGIPDPWVWMAYLLCVASALACVAYSWRNWNRGDEIVREDDVRWAKKQDQFDDKL